MNAKHAHAPRLPVEMARKHTAEELRELVEGGCLTVGEATKFSGMSRSRLFLLIGSGRVVSWLEGTRRVIPKRELVRYLAERAQEEQAKQSGEVS